MKRSFLLILIASLAFGCLPNQSSVSVSFNKAKKAAQASTIPSATVSSIEIINNQLVITGSGLNDVTNVKVGGTAFDESFTIDSKTSTKIIASSIRAFSFDVSKVFNLIISDANASATFPIDFSLCNSTLNGKGFNCAAPVSDKDVLAYDAVSGKWKPRPASGLNYLGTFDASSNPGAGPAIQPAGAYYVISDDGTIAAVSFAVGDWLVSNGTTWQKIDNSSAVLSVHGRFGAISALKGDYTLGLLGDVSFPTAPVAGKVLKFDGTNWVASDDLAGGGAGSVTTATIAAGAVTDAKIDSVSASKITGTINSSQILDGTIVNADINAAAAIDYSKLNIPNTTIPYAKLNIADGEIPAAKVSGLLTLPSGTSLQYYAGDKTLQTLNTMAVPESGTNYYFTDARVRSATLTGLSAGAGNIAAADTVLGALGKLLTTQTDYVSKSANSTVLSELTVSGTGTIVVPTPTMLTHAANMGYVQNYVDAYGQWAKSGSDIYRGTGKVGIGMSTPTHPLTVLAPGSTTPLYSTWVNTAGAPPMGVYSDSSTSGSMDLLFAGANNGVGVRPVVIGRKSAGTLDTPTALSDGHTIFSFMSSGYDGATFRNNASIDFDIGGAVSVGNLPTDIVLKTGSTTRAEKMRVTSAGNVGIGTSTPLFPLHVQGTSVNGSIGVDYYADTTTSGGLAFRKARGTSAAPTAVQSGDFLASFSARGYGATGFSSVGRAAMVAQAAENWTDAAQGSSLIFQTTDNGSTARHDRLKIDHNGNIGIGTNSPQTLMHLYASDTTFKELRMDAARNNSGAYGISFVKSRGVTGARTAAQSNDSLGDLNWSPYVDSDTIVGASARIRAIASENATLTGNGGLLQFMTTPNGTLLPVERMRIAQDGNIGFGTNNPQAPLDIVHDTSSWVRIQQASGDSNGAAMGYFKSRGTVAAPLAVNAGDRIMGLYASGYHSGGAFGGNTGAIQILATENFTATAQGSKIDFGTTPIGGTARSTRMTIDSAGNLGVGTMPSKMLHVQKDQASDTALLIKNVSTGDGAISAVDLETDANGIQLISYGSGSTGNWGASTIPKANSAVLRTYTTTPVANMGVGTGSAAPLHLITSDTPRITMTGAGLVGVGITTPDEKFVVYNGTTTGKYTTGGWTHSSDRRLKHDISPIEDALNKVLKITGVEYKFNSDSENKTQLGFIAQDVEPIFPEVVQTDKKGFKSMIYSNLIAPLVESVKTLYERIIGIEKHNAIQDRQIASKADRAETIALRATTNLLREENEKLKKENDAIKTYLCSKDPKASICK